MIEQINIKNFRCFKELEVADLRRVNLLVGPNASGKSALMESIFITSSAYAANAAIQLRAIRRMGNQLLAPVDAQSYHGIWDDLFYGFNPEKKISIKISGLPNSDSRSLSVEYTTPLAKELPFGKQSASDSSIHQITVMPQIEFKWKRTGYPEVVSRPKFTPTGLQVDITSATFFPSLWFTPGVGETPDDNAKRFSELDKRGAIKPVIEAITKEFPSVKSLSIQYHAGIPMLFADIEGRTRKIPVPLISDGVNRLVSICVGMGYFEGGTILIDQLEDGFHHKILPSIWKSICSLATEFKVQLFVSTHSKECMDAMLPSVKGHEEDFCLLRTYQRDDICRVDSLSGDYLESALEQDFEVR